MSSTISRIGKYELRRVVFPRTPTSNLYASTVYDAWDCDLARQVAIKTINIAGAGKSHESGNPPFTRAGSGAAAFSGTSGPGGSLGASLSDAGTEEPLEGMEALDRFRRSARAAAKLVHPHIASVYDYGETDDRAYIAMEFVDGPTLKELFERKQRFDLDDIIDIVCSILQALQYSHEHRVVHRDIKPANVMFTSDMRLKLTDFGIARIEDSSVTQTGTIMGTPAYMSPEQFLGEKVDLRADIYSTGVILYEMLTGERPYEGTVATIMHKVLYTWPPPPSRISSIANPTFDAIVARAMAKKRDQRYESANAFMAALRAAKGPDLKDIANDLDHPAPGFDGRAEGHPRPPGSGPSWEDDRYPDNWDADHGNAEGWGGRDRKIDESPAPQPASASRRTDPTQSWPRSPGTRLAAPRPPGSRGTSKRAGAAGQQVPGQSDGRKFAGIAAVVIVLMLAGGAAAWILRGGTHTGRQEATNTSPERPASTGAGASPVAGRSSGAGPLEATPSAPGSSGLSAQPLAGQQAPSPAPPAAPPAIRPSVSEAAPARPAPGIPPAQGLPSAEAPVPLPVAPSAPLWAEPERKAQGDAGSGASSTYTHPVPAPDLLALPLPPPPPPQTGPRLETQLPVTPVPSFLPDLRNPRRPGGPASKPESSTFAQREPKTGAPSPSAGPPSTQHSQPSQGPGQDATSDREDSTLPEWLRSARRKSGDAPPAPPAAEPEGPPSDVPVTSVSGLVGLICQSVTAETARALGLDSPQGMVVQGVTSGSTASQAGINRNDVILSVNGQAMRDLGALRRFAGQRVPVELLRKGRHVTVQLQIANG